MILMVAALIPSLSSQRCRCLSCCRTLKTAHGEAKFQRDAEVSGIKTAFLELYKLIIKIVLLQIFSFGIFFYTFLLSYVNRSLLGNSLIDLEKDCLNSRFSIHCCTQMVPT